MRNIETKVIAAAAGSGLGSFLGSFLIWLMGVFLWHGSDAADKATDTAALVPIPVSALVLAVITIAGTYLAGYNAPHTARPDLGEADPSAGVQNVYEAAPVGSVPAVSTPAEPEAPAAGAPPAATVSTEPSLP